MLTASQFCDTVGNMKVERGTFAGGRARRPRTPGARLALPAVVAGVVAATMTVGVPLAAGEETLATFAPSLSPARPGARASLTLALHYAGGETGVPSPVRRLLVRFPAGLSIDIPRLRSCAPARLRSHGPSGCPAQSRVGGGHALAEAREGSQLIKEDISLSAFVGPPRGTQPTIEILGEGLTPIQERLLLTGALAPDEPPYGEEMTVSVPPVPTLVHEPDASIVTLSLTIGPSRRMHENNAVLVPAHCPAAGLPFASEFSFADGSSGSAQATVRCSQ